MSKTFNSFNALKKAIQKEVQDAMNEVVNTSFVNAHSNVDQFYSSPEGRYKRTGQFSRKSRDVIVRWWGFLSWRD